MFRTSLAILALSATALAAPAFADSHGADLPGEVKARKAHMALNGHNIGVLARMARGDAEYDAEAAVAAASNIAALSALDQRTYWTPGTDSESVPGSRALPALWDNIPDAIAKGQALNAAATAATETAGDGLDAMRAALGAIGNACQSCHDDYQKPNN